MTHDASLLLMFVCPRCPAQIVVSDARADDPIILLLSRPRYLGLGYYFDCQLVARHNVIVPAILANVRHLDLWYSIPPEAEGGSTLEGGSQVPEDIRSVLWHLVS